MVLIALQILADLENIAEIKGTSDLPYFVQVKCTNCGDTSDVWHDIREAEKTRQDSRNTAGHNFYMKCKLCKRENTIDIVEKSVDSYKDSDAPNYKTIVKFDCRGIEPINFEPRTGFVVCSANNGQVFEDVDLSEKEFVEYDEKNKVSVGIYNMVSRFVTVKK